MIAYQIKITSILAIALSLGSLKAQETINTNSNLNTVNKEITFLSKNKGITKTSVTNNEGRIVITVETLDTDILTNVLENQESKARPHLGVVLLIEDHDNHHGVKIRSILAGSPAAAANLKEGDVLQSLGENFFSTHAQLVKAISSYKIGDKAELKYLREGTVRKVDITFTKAPKMLTDEISKSFAYPAESRSFFYNSLKSTAPQLLTPSDSLNLNTLNGNPKNIKKSPAEEIERSFFMAKEAYLNKKEAYLKEKEAYLKEQKAYLKKRAK